MTASRLEQILTRLARHHAPHLLGQSANSPEEHWRRVAYGLAKTGILILMADVPAALRPNREALVNQWIGSYATLYHLLTDALFPSLQKPPRAVYADSHHPVLVVMEADAGFVLQGFAGYIVPYVAARQDDKLLSEAEMRGVMTMVLDDLEANDLALAQYERLLSESVALIRGLLEQPLLFVTLTDFVRPIFQELKTPAPPPPPPPHLPEVQKLVTQELFVSTIPIFYQRPGSGGKPRPRPPVLPPGSKNEP